MEFVDYVGHGSDKKEFLTDYVICTSNILEMACIWAGGVFGALRILRYKIFSKEELGKTFAIILPYPKQEKSVQWQFFHIQKGRIKESFKL